MVSIACANTFLALWRKITPDLKLYESATADILDLARPALSGFPLSLVNAPTVT